MPRTPAPKTYRTELPLSGINESSQALAFIEDIRAVANPVLVIEFEGKDLWEIHEICSELEANHDIKIDKPKPV